MQTVAVASPEHCPRHTMQFTLCTGQTKRHSLQDVDADEWASGISSGVRRLLQWAFKLFSGSGRNPPVQSRNRTDFTDTRTALRLFSVSVFFLVFS